MHCAESLICEEDFASGCVWSRHPNGRDLDASEPAWCYKALIILQVKLFWTVILCTINSSSLLLSSLSSSNHPGSPYFLDFGLRSERPFFADFTKSFKKWLFGEHNTRNVLKYLYILLIYFLFIYILNTYIYIFIYYSLNILELLQNFSFRVIRTATFERFCEICKKTASPNACQNPGNKATQHPPGKKPQKVNWQTPSNIYLSSLYMNSMSLHKIVGDSCY